jgi:hypothetical protein
MIAGVLKPGEQAAACIPVTFPRLGIDWLEGARPPVRPHGAERVATAVLSPLETAFGVLGQVLKRGQARPSVSPVALKAAGARGSVGYRLVHAVRDGSKFWDSLYCVVTAERAIFTRRLGSSKVLEPVLDVPLSEIAGIARKRDTLTFSQVTLAIAFSDSSLATVIVRRRDASGLADLLAPGGGRVPQPGDYGPPWENSVGFAG